MAFSEQAPSRHAHYGQHWGEGAARYFSIEGDFLNEDQAVRLLPVPDSFICPISAIIMEDPVATVDGCAYERESIERWFRERRQGGQDITSPITGLALPSATLMPLVALQRAIEAYLAHRPELKRAHLAGRSFEEAAQILQSDLFEKQTMHSTAREEIKRLRQANKTLRRLLRESEAALVVASRSAASHSGTSASGFSATGSSNPAPEATADAGAEAGTAAFAGGRSAAPQSGASASETSAAASSSGAATADAVAAAPPLSGPAASPSAASSSSGGPDSVARADDGTRRQKRVSQAAPLREEAVRPEARSAADPCAHRTATASTGTTPVLPGTTQKGKRRKQGRGCCRDFVALALVAIVVGVAVVQSLVRFGGLTTTATVDGDAVDLTMAPTVTAAVAADQSVGDASKPAPLERVAGGANVRDATARRAEEDRRRLAATRAPSGLESFAVQAQIEQLRSGAADARQRAALTLRNLAVESAENQVAIVQAGALIPLVDLLQDAEPDVREEAARALWNLVRGTREINGRNQLAIAQAGAIGPLIRLLEDPVPRVRVVAAAVLNDLTIDNTGNKVAISRAGAIAPLIKLLINDDAPSLVMASGLLQGLARQNADSQMTHALADAVVPLVGLLTTGSMLAQEEAALTLGIFATCGEEIQTAIVRAGAVAPLVERLKGDLMQGTAALALRNLASDNADSQAAIARAGAIEPLVRLLEDGAPGVREEAANALLALSKDNIDNQLLIMEYEGVVPLADLLKGDLQASPAGGFHPQ
mmetsp:Transcript_108798/g.306598  ORF Transcript_108798/g.306598 Transcript_108798/m.306598 type:complete len:768 (+) Transcript_108798:130-2433(+)